MLDMFKGVGHRSEDKLRSPVERFGMYGTLSAAESFPNHQQILFFTQNDSIHHTPLSRDAKSLLSTDLIRSSSDFRRNPATYRIVLVP